MQDGALNHTLETERRLSFDFVIAGNCRSMFCNEGGEFPAQFINIRGARSQDFSSGRIVERLTPCAD